MARHLYIVCILVCLVASFAEGHYPEDEQSLRHLYQRWLHEYNNWTKYHKDTAARFATFKQNVNHINKLNKAYNGETEFALNQFAHMSPEEFQTRILMPSKPAPTFEPSRYIRGLTGRDLPDSFDWTEKGAVTPVKDQGDVGTCWAFSTVENIEGQWQRLGQPLTNLSVEQVVECDGTYDHGPNTTHADCGIFGGWPYLAYQYVKKAGGLQTWEDYSYCCGLGGKPGTCEICPAAGYNWTMCGPPVPFCNMTDSCASKINPKKFVPGLKVVDWKAIDLNETTIAEQLMDIGPLSVALDATMLQFYHKGVFDPIFCSKTNLDHAVLIVGFGTEKDIFKSKPYWKVKNSWGPKWGENGYFRINRGAGTCGINTQVTTAVLQKV